MLSRLLVFPRAMILLIGAHISRRRSLGWLPVPQRQRDWSGPCGSVLNSLMLLSSMTWWRLVVIYSMRGSCRGGFSTRPRRMRAVWMSLRSWCPPCRWAGAGVRRRMSCSIRHISVMCVGCRRTASVCVIAGSARCLRWLHGSVSMRKMCCRASRQHGVRGACHLVVAPSRRVCRAALPRLIALCALRVTRL